MHKPIRIMHIVDSLGKGGLENGLVNLIGRMDPHHFEHVVCTVRRLGENAQRLPADRVSVMCLGKKDSDPAIHIPALSRAIREVGPDIVHSRNWGGVEAVVAGWWVHSCSLVHSEHGLDSVSAVDEPRRRKWFRRVAFELADRVLAVSHQLGDLHAQRTGFARQRIAVIHNGVDSQKFCPDEAARARVRSEFGMTDDEFCIGCVANLFPVKDHMTLLRAARELAERTGKWRLLLLGEGPELMHLQEFAAGNPICRERISFLGSSSRVPELLNAMDAYVLPSLIEGISNSLLEAMATGLPVVVTNTGGNPEVVVDGQSGILFPVSDFHQLAQHLHGLSVSKERREGLKKGALARVRNEFSIDSMVQKYETLYGGLRPAVSAPLRSLAGA